MVKEYGTDNYRPRRGSETHLPHSDYSQDVVSNTSYSNFPNSNINN